MNMKKTLLCLVLTGITASLFAQEYEPLEQVLAAGTAKLNRYELKVSISLLGIEQVNFFTIDEEVESLPINYKQRRFTASAFLLHSSRWAHSLWHIYRLCIGSNYIRQGLPTIWHSQAFWSLQLWNTHGPVAARGKVQVLTGALRRLGV